jgi:hypothetical protein
MRFRDTATRTSMNYSPRLIDLRVKEACTRGEPIQNQETRSGVGNTPLSVSLAECERRSTATKTCTQYANVRHVMTQPINETGR